MCFHIPSVKDGFEIGRKLELHYLNVGSAVPLWFAFGIETCKAKTSEDATSTLIKELSKNEWISWGKEEKKEKPR